MKKAIIVPNYLKSESIEFCQTAKELLCGFGYDVCILAESEVPTQKADFALVLGGDGTILRACKKLYMLDIPVLGINFGNLGFLTACSPDCAMESITKVVNGEFETENRIMLKCSVLRDGKEAGPFVALNEVTLFRSSLKKAISAEVYINGMHVENVLGDGVIIATPTGSTSYNMSAGGAVLMPESDNMVITPLSPMRFGCSSIVTQGKDDIEIRVKINAALDASAACLEIDGNGSFDICDGDVLKIEKVEKTAKIIKVNNTSFYNTLKKKLFKE